MLTYSKYLFVLLFQPLPKSEPGEILRDEVPIKKPKNYIFGSLNTKLFVDSLTKVRT